MKKLTNIILAAVLVLLLVLGFAVSAMFTDATLPEGEEEPLVSITGAKVLCRFDLRNLYGGGEKELTVEEGLLDPWYMVTITETQVNSFIVVVAIGILCYWLTRDLKVTPEGKKQLVAEWLVTKVQGLISDNMSQRFMSFAPFIGALFAISALSSLCSLLGWYPPTADLNTLVGWALVVFIMITRQKLHAGLGEYLKGYTKPVVVLLPINVVSEIATPVSMAFRHFGNVCSGAVISVLLTAVLTLISKGVWALIGVTGILSEFAFFRVGLPVVFSLYFDIFSGLLQAFIFCILTMINVYLAFEDAEETLADKRRRREEKAAKKAAKAAAKAATKVH